MRFTDALMLLSLRVQRFKVLTVAKHKQCAYVETEGVVAAH